MLNQIRRRPLASWATLALAAAGCCGQVAALSLAGSRCGQLICDRAQYCSADTGRCAPCANICNKDNHNYDVSLCEKECQDYIHDQRYMSNSSPGEDSSLKATVQDLRHQVKISLVISCFLIVLIAAYVAIKCWVFCKRNRDKFTWKYIQKKLHFSKNRVKHHPTEMTHQNPHMDPKIVLKPDLKLDLSVRGLAETNKDPSKTKDQPLNARDLAADTNNSTEAHSQGGAQTPKTISTTISNRHPAEDASLDYSYDNLGMNLAPSPGPTESGKNKF